MGIRTISDYVKFYIGLNMQNSISLSSFIYNEKLVLKNKLDSNSMGKESILHGLRLLDELLSEIQNYGERTVLEKYRN
jgi:hypothetical protein